MAKGIIIVTLIGIAIVAAIAGIFYFYEKPIQQVEALSYINLSITASNNLTKEPLEANYAVLLESNTVPSTTGKTLKEGFILEYVTANRSYRVAASAPGFYSTEIERFSEPGAPIRRTDLLLEPIGNLTVSQVGELRRDTNVNLTLRANGRVNNIHFCAVWSAKIITLNPIGNFTQITPFPIYASSYDKCYSTGLSLRNEELIIPFEYRKFGELESEDFINLTFIDADSIYSSLVAVAFESDTDIGMKNLVYGLA